MAAGQPIGSLQAGQSHCSPRVCLHWGLLRGRVYLNPLLLVGGGPVRLLPLRGAPPAGAGPPSTSSAAVGPAPRGRRRRGRTCGGPGGVGGAVTR